ncbi:MAG: hypothetical protein FWG31_09530 [Oscillospiraceae bacterium]|nr:hypothetical protein [Oscillospiraceae bacterium]
MKTRKALSMLVALAMLIGLATVPAAVAVPDVPYALYVDTPPVLGENDAVWNGANVLELDVSNAKNDKSSTTGKAKVLWDDSFLYVRVVVTDDDVFEGSGGSQWLNDSVELFVGPGTGGVNQYRVSATNDKSGTAVADSWASIEDPGYIVEFKIAKGSLAFEDGAMLTFEVQINDSTSAGGDRDTNGNVISWAGDPDTGYSSDASFKDSIALWKADGDDDDDDDDDDTDAKGGRVELGATNFVNPDNPTKQVGWLLEGDLIEQFASAESLVIEFDLAALKEANADGIGGIAFIINNFPAGEEKGNWNQTEGITPGWTNWGDLEASTNTKADITIDGDVMTFVITLADMNGFDEVSGSGKVWVLIAHFGGIEDVNDAILNAYFGEDEEEEEEPGEPGLDNFDPKYKTYDNNFADVANLEDAYKQWVIKAYEYGIIAGTSSTNFGVGSNLKISEAIIIAVKIHVKYMGGTSADYPADPDAYVAYAIENGIIKTGDFADVTKDITRAEMAYIWGNILDADDLAVVSGKTFISQNDVAVGDKYYDSIKLFYEAGITTGSGGNKYGSNELILREHCAIFFVRLVEPESRSKSANVYEAEEAPDPVIKLDDYTTANAGWNANYLYDTDEIFIEVGQAFKLEFTVELKAGTRFFVEAPKQPGDYGGEKPAMRNADDIIEDGPMGNGYLAAEHEGTYLITWYAQILGDAGQLKAFNHSSSPEAVTMTDITLIVYTGEDDENLEDGEWDMITFKSKQGNHGTLIIEKIS